MLERGSIIRASVLDVSKIERLVDLSLKLEFVDRSKGERSTVLTHKKVSFNTYCIERVSFSFVMSPLA